MEITQKARKMKVTSLAGTSIEFENDPNRPFANEHVAQTPGPHFLTGQIGCSMVIRAILFEFRVPEVAPQNSHHAELVGLLEGVGDLHDLAPAIL